MPTQTSELNSEYDLVVTDTRGKWSSGQKRFPKPEYLSDVFQIRKREKHTPFHKQNRKKH